MEYWSNGVLEFESPGLLQYSITLTLTVPDEATKVVTPAQAGVQNSFLFLDSGFRRNDGRKEL
jgi:hypothetical protein